MSSSLNRRLGREFATHLDSAKDLIDQAIEATSEGNYAQALKCWREARGHCTESKDFLAHTWFKSCELAIARLELAVKGDPEQVDLQPALHPDLGQAAAKRRQQERAEEAQLEAAQREKIAEYNRRRHGADIAELEQAIGKLRPGSGALATAQRFLADLVEGRERGFPEVRRRHFRNECRREGVKVS